MKKLFIGLYLISSFLCAQDGTLDLTFNSDDVGFGSGFGTNNAIEANVVLPNGDIAFGGNFTSYNDISLNRLVLVDDQGNIDPNFNIGTGFNLEVNFLAAQSDGKLFVSGFFSSYNDIATTNFLRLNTDGSIDNSFNIGSGFDGLINTLDEQSDGKIIVGGNFSNFNGNVSNSIIRLNTDGSLDTSFSTGSGFNNSVFSIYIQTDGKIVVGGFFTEYNGTAVNRIVRLNSDGSIDTSFNTGSGFDSSVNSINQQLDGKLIIGGFFTSYNSTTSNRILRLNTDGTLDSSFSIGTGFNSGVRDINIQSDQKIILTGNFQSYDGVSSNHIIRLNNDGSIDTSYDFGTGTNNNILSAHLQSDGKIIISGAFTIFNNKNLGRIGRLNTDGCLDTTFNRQTGANTTIVGLSYLDDGKMMVYGDFDGYNGEFTNKLTRINSDGSVDDTFTARTVTEFNSGGAYFKVVEQNDGKYLLGGLFSNYDGLSNSNLIRVNNDGSFDSTFDIGDGVNFTIANIVLQPDGKPIISGPFTTVNNITNRRIARLNTDGSLDNTFNSGAGFGPNINIDPNNSVFDIALQSDNKIIASGNFSVYDGIPINDIARLNTNGSLDTTFNPGTGANNSIFDVALQDDGKIIVVGNFTLFNGQSHNAIVRLNTDGSLDTTFNIGTGANAGIDNIVIQDDGKIIIVGIFSDYNGFVSEQIARLNSDGSFDTTFNIGTGANNFIINDVALQDDGNIVIVGDFTAFNGVGRNRIARINASNTLYINDLEPESLFGIFPNPTKDQFTIQLDNPLDLKNVIIYNDLGQLVLTSKEVLIDTSKLASGTYIVETTTTKGKSSKKLIIE